MSEEKKTRCPSCNPIHGSGRSGFGFRVMNRHRLGEIKCELCGDTRKVSVEASLKYIAALNGTEDRPIVKGITYNGGGGRIGSKSSGT